MLIFHRWEQLVQAVGKQWLETSVRESEIMVVSAIIQN